MKLINSYKFILIIICLTNTFNIILTQEEWSLKNCIDYAEKNNLSLQSKNVDLIIAKINQNQSNLNYLPSINLGGTHGYNWGQSIDPFTNEFATDRIQTNNLYAGSSWTLFSGLQNYYHQQYTNLSYQETEQDVAIVKRNLKIDITAAFMHIVLNHFLVQAQQEQLNYTLQQEETSKERFELGYITKYDWREINNQLTIDSAALIQAQNNERYSLLILQQLLNKEEQFAVKIPTIAELESVIDNNYTERGFTNNPEFELAKIQRDLQMFKLKIAKAKLYPNLKLNSSIGSGYSGNSKQLVDGQFVPKPFRIQLEENFYQSAVLTLNIPIFNNGRVRTEIKIAEAEIIKSKVEQDITLLKLRNKLEKLENEITNEEVNLNALKKALTAMKERFEITTDKYNAGTINFLNYLEVKNKLLSTQSDFYSSLITLRFKQEMCFLMLSP